ncbi:MAG: response regulator [Fimbriimonas sp.]|nr:response regulator [Fimbriimonas sp.]
MASCAGPAVNSDLAEGLENVDMAQDLKVLIVDCDVAVHGFARRALGRVCPHPMVTRSFAEGIRMARTHHPDVVLIDVDLHDFEGSSVVADLRKEMKGQIIVASARWGTADQTNAMAAGADDYLLKPFFADELLARIESRNRAKAA